MFSSTPASPPSSDRTSPRILDPSFCDPLICCSGHFSFISCRNVSTLDPVIAYPLQPFSSSVRIAKIPNSSDLFDSDYVVVSSRRKKPHLTISNLCTGSTIHISGTHNKHIWALDTMSQNDIFSSPSNSSLVLSSGDGDGICLISSALTGQPIDTLPGPPNNAYALKCIPEWGEVVVGGFGKCVRYDLASGRQIGVFQGHHSAVDGISVSLERGVFCSAAFDDTVRVWGRKEAKNGSSGRSEKRETEGEETTEEREKKDSSSGPHQKEIACVQLGEKAYSCCCIDESNALFVGLHNGGIAVIDIRTFTEICRFNPIPSSRYVEFMCPCNPCSPFGSSSPMMMTSVSEKAVSKWNISTTQLVSSGELPAEVMGVCVVGAEDELERTGREDEEERVQFLMGFEDVEEEIAVVVFGVVVVQQQPLIRKLVALPASLLFCSSLML